MDHGVHTYFPPETGFKTPTIPVLHASLHSPLGRANSCMCHSWCSKAFTPEGSRDCSRKNKCVLSTARSIALLLLLSQGGKTARKVKGMSLGAIWGKKQGLQILVKQNHSALSLSATKRDIEDACALHSRSHPLHSLPPRHLVTQQGPEKKASFTAGVNSSMKLGEANIHKTSLTCSPPSALTKLGCEDQFVLWLSLAFNLGLK